MAREEAQITINNITKKYGTNTILDQVNLKIYKGDFITIFGKSGSGKTTLLNILGTLEDYDSGEMEILSHKDPVKDEKNSMTLRRNNIAYLFQNFALVEKMTVEENMKLAVKYNQEKNKDQLIKESLNKMGILEKLKSKVYELSGGEQQRVALARNMVKPFDILLADEPTGSLDEENKKIVIDTLIDLNEKGKTIVVVSHDKDFEKIAKNNLFIEDGNIKEMS